MQISTKGSLSVETDHVYSRFGCNEEANSRKWRRSSSLHEAAPATSSMYRLYKSGFIPTVAHNCYGKTQFITAKYNSKQQIQITPGRLQTLTAKTKTIIAIQNSPRQEQNTRGKSKTLTAKAKRSRQNQEWRSAVNGQRLSKTVVYQEIYVVLIVKRYTTLYTTYLLLP